jgi:glycine/D-amino acid oxidase-like deaminating enzyme
MAIVVRAAVWIDELTDADRAALSPGVPADPPRRPDVLVVGGGVIGLATAVACRDAGLGSVVLLEREERLAPAASGGNGGSIAPDMHALTDPPEFVAFGRASLRRHVELADRFGHELRTTRWLQILPDGDLDRAAVRDLEPDLVLPDGAGARLVPDQRAVNPLKLAAALTPRAGTVATGVAMTGVAQVGDRITVVRTTVGDFQPGAVVVSTGLVPAPWSHGVEQHWVKGHMLALAPGPWRLGSVVSSDGFGGGNALPDGTILCGGTFDDGDSSPDVRPSVIAGLAAAFHQLLPAARDAAISHQWCCFRPVVVGRHPVIDRLPGTVNGWVSAGHFTTGVMMAPGTGYALASWLASGLRPDGVATFDLPGGLAEGASGRGSDA